MKQKSLLVVIGLLGIAMLGIMSLLPLFTQFLIPVLPESIKIQDEPTTTVLTSPLGYTTLEFKNPYKLDRRLVHVKIEDGITPPRIDHYTPIRIAYVEVRLAEKPVSVVDAPMRLTFRIPTTVRSFEKSTYTWWDVQVTKPTVFYGDSKNGWVPVESTYDSNIGEISIQDTRTGTYTVAIPVTESRTRVLED